MDRTPTCWTLIRGAADGNGVDRDQFARRYLPVVTNYLGERWRYSSLRMNVADATQEVFIECYREGGVLAKVDQSRPGGFRALLFAVVRNVARRAERTKSRRRERQPDTGFDFGAVVGRDNEFEHAFDRAWALGIVRHAARLMADRAQDRDERARRRVELLRLRFQDEAPIREIAKLWDVEAAWLHHQYALARNEFEDALFEVVAFHSPGTPAEVRKECASLLVVLGQK